MRTHLVSRGVIVLAVAILSLALVWLFLSPVGQAGSTPNREPGLPPLEVKPPPTPSPDPRWLSLVRASWPVQAIQGQSSHQLAAQWPVRPSQGQATSPTINVHLTDGFVAGHVALASTVVVSVTRDGAWVAYANVIPFPDESGYFYLAYLTWDYSYATGGGGGGYYAPLQADDVVWVAQAGDTVSMTIPALSALAAAQSDTVYGTAPASQTVTAHLFPFGIPDVSYTRVVTADASGNYQVIWTPEVDLHPQDSGYIAYVEDANRRAYIRFVAPFLRAGVASQDVSGYVAPHNSVAITLTDAEGNPWLQTYSYADSEGFFYIYPNAWDKNETRPLRPGDRVIVTAGSQTFSMTVMTITAHADLANSQVWGEAPAGQSVEVLRFSGPLASGYDYYLWDKSPTDQTIVTATMTGHYTATWPVSTVALPLSAGDYGVAIAASSEGYQTYARFAAPYLWVRMGESNWGTLTSNQTAGGGCCCVPPPSSPYYYEMWGQVDDMAAPITIAIQGPSGYLKDLHFVTSAGNGYFYDAQSYGQRLILDGGDVITLTTPHGVQAAFTLPQLTAQADPISDTVSGLAPPGAPLAVTVFAWSPCQPIPPSLSGLRIAGGCSSDTYTLIVTATAQGEYRADFSGLADIVNYTYGEVRLTSPEGYSMTRAFRAGTICQVVLGYVQVGGNRMTGVSSYCYNAIIRLRNAQGQVKAETWLDPEDGYTSRYFYDTRWCPAAILPGDTIEVEYGSQPITPTPTPTPTPAPTRYPNAIQVQSGNQLITIPVPLLTVSLDAVANTIAGLASPQTILTLDIYREDMFQRQLTTTVSAEGHYSVSLAGQYALGAGDRVRVIDYSTALPYFFVQGVLPLLQADLYQTTLGGWLPPLTPYTLSVVSSHPITTQASGYATTEGRFYPSYPYPLQITFLPGDTVVVTTPQQVLQLTLPFLSAQVELATALVYGQAPPQSRLRVDLTSDPYEYPQTYRSQVVTATASGVYTASFPDLAPMSSIVGRLVYFNEDGYQVRLSFSATTPQWRTVLDEPCVSGNAGVIGTPITVTLRAANGTLKGTRASFADFGLGSFTACFTQTVQPSDELSLIQPTGVITFTVPELTAEHNFGRQAVEGQTFPNAPVVVSVQATMGYYYWGLATRHTRADATGHYGVDTSDLGLRLGYTGWVVVSDEAGNTIQRNFTIRGYRAYLPMVSYSR